MGSPARREYGLDVPLMSRLLGAGLPSLLLEIQYRMHPVIAEFPSQLFYAGRVRSGVKAADRPPIRVSICI
jgi:regulator of nonsense transcripts 1